MATMEGQLVAAQTQSVETVAAQLETPARALVLGALGSDRLTARTLYERVRRIDPECTLAEFGGLVSVMMSEGKLEMFTGAGPHRYRVRKQPPPGFSSFPGLTASQRKTVCETLCRHLGRRYGGRWVIRTLGKNDPLGNEPETSVGAR